MPLANGVNSSSNSSLNCSNGPANSLSPYTSIGSASPNNLNSIPQTNDEGLTINVNFLILQNANGEGNFKEVDDVPGSYLDQIRKRMIYNFDHLIEENSCPAEGYISRAKINWNINTIYYPTFMDEWNNLNCTDNQCCPNNSFYLDALNVTIESDPTYKPGINVYFTTDSVFYQRIVLNGEIIPNGFYTPFVDADCAESPTYNFKVLC